MTAECLGPIGAVKLSVKETSLTFSESFSGLGVQGARICISRKKNYVNFQIIAHPNNALESHSEWGRTKGQMKSECVYEIIDFPKYHQKKLIDLCPESLFRLGMLRTHLSRVALRIIKTNHTC